MRWSSEADLGHVCLCVSLQQPNGQCSSNNNTFHHPTTVVEAEAWNTLGRIEFKNTQVSISLSLRRRRRLVSEYLEEALEEASNVACQLGTNFSRLLGALRG